MTTTMNLRKTLDRKQWEFCTPSPVATTAGMHIASSRLSRQMQYTLASASVAWKYLPEEDGWEEVPAPALGGTFAVGACSACTAYSVGYLTTPTQIGAPVTAISSAIGTTATIITANNYGINALGGYLVRCIAGTSANLGQVRTVVTNTANTITTTAFSAITQLNDVFSLEPITQIVAGTGSSSTLIAAISAINGTLIGTTGNLPTTAVPFNTYQIRCTQTVLASVANQGVTRTISTSTTNSVTVGVAFPSAIQIGDVFVIEPYALATASGAGTNVAASTTVVGSSTIVTTNAWLINAFSNYQIRCLTATAGTASNIGQVRLILSNTATTITTQSPFPIATASTDTFSIEPIVYSQELTYTGLSTTGASVTANGVGTTTTVVTGNTWTVNAYVGAQIKAISGTAANIGQIRTVVSNTSNTLTTTAFGSATASSDAFELSIIPILAGAGVTPWLSGQWANAYQARITAGTGISQIRQIVNNTGAVLIVAQPWTTLPDATSQFIIEPVIKYSATSTIATNQTIARDLRGFKIRLQSVGGVFDECTIESNTIGANAIYTVSHPFTTAPTPPPSYTSAIIASNAIGTTTTIVTGNTWIANQWVGYQVKSLSGTAGNLNLMRTVVSNTTTTLTLSVALPSATASADTFELDYYQSPALIYTTSTITASGTGTLNTIVTSNAWTVNAYAGTQIKVLTGTAGNIGLLRTVLSNTATTLTISSNLPVATASSDTFELDTAITASTNGTVNTIVTSNSWTTNAYVGAQVRTLTGTSANIGVLRTVLSNTTTTLTLSSNLPASTTIGDIFELVSFTGASITATSGSSTSIVASSATWVNNQYLGYQARAISGTVGNIGIVRPITGNTITQINTVAFPSAIASSDIFIVEPFQSVYTTSTYQLQATRWWVMNAHTATPVAHQFRYFDYAYNAWFSIAGFSAGAVAGIPPVGAAWGTDGKLVSTPSIVDSMNSIFTTGNVTSATTYTLVNSTKIWAINQWNGAYQVRITSGTGNGQVRQIVGNNATTLFIPSWTTIPDSTSTYIIEGNDDAIYLYGNGAVTLFKLYIGSGAWNLLTPMVPRSAAPGVGLSGHWTWSTPEPIWTNENNIVSGRRIYSFRGAGGALVDYYDIALNSWVNDLTYGAKTAVFGAGTKYAILQGRYIYIQKDATNRWYRFDPISCNLDPIGQFLYPQGVAVGGDTCFDASYIDPDNGTIITWIYMVLNTSQVMLRMMVI